MAQYLKVNWGSGTTNVPTKTTIDNIVNTIPNKQIYADTALNAPNGTYGITCSNFAPISANGGSVGALDRPYRSFIGWNFIYPNATTTNSQLLLQNAGNIYSTTNRPEEEINTSICMEVAGIHTDGTKDQVQLFFRKTNDDQYTAELVPSQSVNVDLGSAARRFRNLNSRNIYTQQVIPEQTTGSQIGTGDTAFANGYFENINAGSATIRGTSTVNGAIRSNRPADSNSRIFNIFADVSAAAADTTAYGTATQLVTYYKNGANAEPTPHYLRFQAASDTTATLTFSRANAGDTVGIGSNALPFDWLYAKNVYSTGTAYLQNGATVAGTIAPSSVGGAMLGTSTNRFGDCYFGNITVGSITPINGTSYSLGTSSAPFNSAYVNTVTIKTALNPDASGGATLGSSTLPWGTAYLGSTYTYTIMPRSDSSYSLGSSSIRWSTIYGDTVNVATGIVPDTNTGAYIGTSTNRFTTSYFSTLNVSTGLTPDSAGGAYVGTSTSYMSTGYFTNLYNRGSYGSNYRIPVIRYGSGEPPTSGMSTGDVYIRYES